MASTNSGVTEIEIRWHCVEMRRECLDHVIVFHEGSLRSTLKSFLECYHRFENASFVGVGLQCWMRQDELNLLKSRLLRLLLSDCPILVRTDGSRRREEDQ